MKLRLRGNSIRLRLSQADVSRLADAGAVEESLKFGHGDEFVYRLQSRREVGPMSATFQGGIVEVSVFAGLMQSWMASDEVGIYGQSHGVAIAIEKDFRCLVERPGEGDADAFPRPKM